MSGLSREVPVGHEQVQWTCENGKRLEQSERPGIPLKAILTARRGATFILRWDYTPSG